MEPQALPLQVLSTAYPRIGRTPQASKNQAFSPICCILRSCSPSLAPRRPNIAQDSQENTILEPTSSNIAPKSLPRQPPAPSRGGPNPKQKHKKLSSVTRFALRQFFKRSRESDLKMLPDSPKAPELSPTWPSWR